MKKTLFGSKIATYLSLGIHGLHPIYRRNHRPSKENIQNFKTRNFFTFSIFVGNFCPSGSGTVLSRQNQSGFGSATQLLTIALTAFPRFAIRSGAINGSFHAQRPQGRFE
jgi:hypothetical protein